MTAAAVAAMLAARSVAVVGASDRPGSFGERMTLEALRGNRRVHLVNPRYTSVGGQDCLPSLDDLPEPVDLVLLGVRDELLAQQLSAAASVGARGAVVFGSAHGAALRSHLREIAVDAGMALCGAGCMGFVNIPEGLRALGYLERAEIAAGPIGLVTHSGSVFSTLLRTRRALGYTLAVSSGQELVTTTADYLDHILDASDAGVVALVLETVRDGPRLVAGLRRAAERDVPVVVLPLGASDRGAALVQAHSGALAGARGTWEALAEGTGALLVSDLAELTDTLELLAIGRRARHGRGIATVHDSGAERALVADTADTLNVPFATVCDATLAALASALDDGLVAENPLDLWGNGADTRALFGHCLTTLASDPDVAVTALAVDLVAEYDGDTSYPDAVLDAAKQTDAPLVVLTSLASAVDEDAARTLRAAGVPVLEGTRSGLVALRHLLALTGPPPEAAEPEIDTTRRDRWRARLADPQPLDGAESFALIADYGIAAVGVRAAGDVDAAGRAATELGYPVVLKTDVAGIAHKTEARGVLLGLANETAVRQAYVDLAARLGPDVLVCATADPGVEIALGLVRDPALGPIVVVAAGGVLAELVDDRAVGLPPLDRERALNLLRSLRIHGQLTGWRGAPAADLDALTDAVLGLSQLAVELGDVVEAVDINPVLAGPHGAVAVDAYVARAQKIA